MPQITLYRKDGSCSMVPNIVLRELGLPFTPVVMKPGPTGYEGADGTLSRVEFLKINPKGFVPTLVVDGTVVTEMTAVLSYIMSVAPDDRGLMGRSAIERAKVLEWTTWLSGTLHACGFGAKWRPERWLGADAAKGPREAVVEGGMRIILSSFAMIEDQVKGDPFAVGRQLTVVDVFLHTFWRWGNAIAADMTKYPRWRAIVENVEKLASVKAAMAEENVPLQFPDSSSVRSVHL